MHAILFQMALMPLTMVRYTIASLSNSVIEKFIPLNKMLRIHIHIGYTIVITVFIATVTFFAFFGTLCSRGEEEYCKKFTSGESLRVTTNKMQSIFDFLHQGYACLFNLW